MSHRSANLRKPRREAGAFRDIEGELPAVALSEALVNALAHRDISPAALGAPVQVRIFVDRVEVENPGGLFGPVSAEDLGVSVTTSARNALLMQLLEDLVMPGTGQAIAEHRGTGIPAMIQALRSAEMSPPKFEDRIGTFRVTFPRESLVDSDTLAWLSGLGRQSEGISRNQRIALALMRSGDPMTNERFRQATGADSRDATRELGELVSRGLVEMRGVNRWVEYILPEAPGSGEPIGNPAGARAGHALPQRRDRTADIVGLLAARGELGRADIQQALGLSQTSVSRWLRILEERGQVEPTTGSPRDPGRRYRLRALGGTGGSTA
ncbi:MAG: ATP-binding protein [Gemmatimonadaceae bacterium]